MMRVLFHLLKAIAIVAKMTMGRNAYMRILTRAYSIHGIKFKGKPRYIHPDALLDPVGGLTVGRNIVVSTRVLILTHDYSYTAGLAAIGRRPQRDLAIVKRVEIGDNCVELKAPTSA